MYKILSIDGGGIKGIISATFLREIQKKTNLSTRELFDCFIGTSTGAIIVAALAAGIEAEEITEIYHKDAPKIFNSPKPKWWQKILSLADEKYETRNLHNALFRRIGGLKLGDLKKRFIFTAYDIELQSYVLFDSFDKTQSHLRVVDCATASAAAPTYFEPHSFEGYNVIDGGVCGLNNPALAAWALSLNHGVSQENMKILSLGNGEYYNKINYSDAINWGILKWARPLIDIMLTGTARMTKDLTKSLLPSRNFFRANIRIPERFSAMDAPQNMKKLEVLALTAIIENKVHGISEFLKSLENE